MKLENGDKIEALKDVINVQTKRIEAIQVQLEEARIKNDNYFIIYTSLSMERATISNKAGIAALTSALAEEEGIYADFVKNLGKL